MSAVVARPFLAVPRLPLRRTQTGARETVVCKTETTAGALVIGSPDVVTTVAAMLEEETEEVFAVDVGLVQVATAEEYRDGVQFVVDTTEGLLGDGLKIDASGEKMKCSTLRW